MRGVSCGAAANLVAEIDEFLNAQNLKQLVLNGFFFGQIPEQHCSPRKASNHHSDHSVGRSSAHGREAHNEFSSEYLHRSKAPTFSGVAQHLSVAAPA
jgi:hypothetical protein